MINIILGAIFSLCIIIMALYYLAIKTVKIGKFRLKEQLKKQGIIITNTLKQSGIEYVYIENMYNHKEICTWETLSKLNKEELEIIANIK